MRHRWWATRRAGVVGALLGLGLTAGGCGFESIHDLPLPGSIVSADESFTVTADFTDVLNVVPRSPVMVSDVPVGEVTDVERIGWHARITMRIREDIEIPDNAFAEIRQTSLLGEKYVALEAPPADQASDRLLADGDAIELAATGRNPEVEEVLGALSFLLSGGGVGQLSTITEELNLAMSGRTDRLRNLLGELDSVVGTLDEQRGDIVRALEAVNNLAATLNAERTTIGEALDVMGPAVGVLADQHDGLIEMLEALDELGVVGTRVINATRADLMSVLRDLKPVLQRLNEAGDSLPNGLSLLISFPFPQEAADVVKGDFANTEIALDISLRHLGGDLIPELPPLLPGETIDDVVRCLASGSLTSPSCRRVLADGGLLNGLLRECRLPANRDLIVCVLLNPLGLGSSGGSGGGGGTGGGLGGLLGGLLGTTSDGGLLGLGGSGRSESQPGVGLFGEGLG